MPTNPVLPATVLGPHLMIGALVLGCYWIALLSRKGSRRHRLAGRVYLLLLGPVLASVVPLTLYFARRADPARVAQLGYLGLVVTTAGWTAWRAVRDRRDVAAFRGPVFRALAAAMFLAGAALLVLGLTVRRPLMIGFSSIGLVYGGAMLRELRTVAVTGWWRVWHLNGVALLFAATHASFVGILSRAALPHLAGETMHTVTQLGTIAAAFGLRFWLVRRFAGARALPPAGMRSDDPARGTSGAVGA